MEVNLLELDKNLDNGVTNKEIESSQNNFLQTNIGKFVNEGIDLGLRATLPDFIEEDVIEIKDVLFNEGFKEALKETVNKAVEAGKGIIGIFTGDIKDVTKLKEILKEGKIINKISKLIDNATKKAVKNGSISSSTSSLIKSSKNAILDVIEDKIDVSTVAQEKGIQTINTSIEKWQEAYKEQNFKKMQTYYDRIKKNLNKYIEIESTITKARQVENIHNLIKNNGKNFNLTKEEIELADALTF